MPIGKRIKHNHPLTVGLVGCWRLDKHQYDYTEHGNHLSSYSTTAYTWGKKSYALDNSSTNYSYLPTQSAALEPDEAVTIAAWVRIPSLISDTVIAGNTEFGIEDYGYFIGTNSSTEFCFSVAQGSGMLANHSFVNVSYGYTIGQWYHVAGCYTADDKLRLYVDGVLVDSIAFTDEIYYDANTHFGIGGSPNNASSADYKCQCDVESVYVYNRELSPAEIKMLYTDSYGIFESADLLTNKPDEGLRVMAAFTDTSYSGLLGDEYGAWIPSLDDDGNGTTTLHDLSGNFNHLTLTNGPAWEASTHTDGIRQVNFDGVNDYAIGEAPGIAASHIFSISMWVRFPTITSNDYFFSIGSSTAGNPYIAFYHSSATQVRVLYRNDAGTLADFYTDMTTTVTTGTWYHMVLTSDGSNVRFYKDNSLVNTPDRTVPPSGSITLDQLSLGALARTSNTNHGNVLMDDVRVFNRVLTSTERTNLYSKPGYLTTDAPDTYNETGSGGVVCAGSADEVLDYDLTGSGGAVAAGSASIYVLRSETGSGGVVAAGEATTNNNSTYTETGSGGAVAAGAADVAVVTTYNETGSGGALCAGAADVAATLIRYANGYKYRKPITVLTNDSNIENFILGISTTVDTANVWTGTDFRIEDTSGNRKYHELRSYDNDTGQVHVFFKTDLSDSTSDYYLYYGNSS